MAEGSRFYVAKIAALLHDPAWKPWIVSQAFGVAGRRIGRVLASVGESRAAGELVAECEKLVVDAGMGFAQLRCYMDYEDGKRVLRCSEEEGGRGWTVDAHQLEAAVAAFRILEPFSPALALAVAREIIGGEISEEADKLAATVDRWMLTYSSEARDVKLDVGKVAYVNPLDPRFRIEPGELRSPSAISVCNYVRKLRELLGEVRGLPLPLLYNLLYLLVEPYWYETCPRCLPLADTRTPTHSVFDHVYATASMVNWVYGCREGKPCGLLVKVDIAGIQQFISAARKTRDLWAGSWLVSLLAWYTIAEAVMLLGGDIVLSPFNAANHFFIATVLQELRMQGVSDGKLGELEERLEEAYLWRGQADQPIVPGTFFLALPCIDDDTYSILLGEARRLKSVENAEELLEALHKCDVESVKRYFARRFMEGWRRFALAVIGSYTSAATGDEAEAVKEFSTKIADCSFYPRGKVEGYLRAAIERPPLQLRVTVVNVREHYEKLLNRLKRERLESGIPVEEAARKLLFMMLFASLSRREEEEYARSVSITAGYAIGDVVEDVTASAAKAFRECTVCGSLPAILHVTDRGECTPAKVAERLSTRSGLFSENELFCPYCLLRRLATETKALTSVMNVLGLYVRGGIAEYPRVPSTCELAAANELMRLADILAHLYKQHGREKLEEILKIVKEMREQAGRGQTRRWERRSREETRIPYKAVDMYVESLEDLGRDVKGVIREIISVLERDLEEEFSCLIAAGKLASREKCAEAFKGRPYEKLGEQLCNLLFNARDELAKTKAGKGVEWIRHTSYYAIVRGDGDFFGKRLVRGILDFASPSDYIKAMLEGVNDEKARSALSRVYEKVTIDLTRLADKLIPSKAGSTTVIVTPTYYMALSRGQMLTALYDATIVEILGGFPVYAGGDDVATLSPGYINPNRLKRIVDMHVKQSKLEPTLNIKPPTGFVPAEIAILTRRNYWGLLGHYKGFHVTPIGAVYPAPVAYGRSYGIYITHYRDPFTAAWTTAGQLEEVKDIVSFEKCCAGSREKFKDVTAISYGRVSGLIMPYYSAIVVANSKPLTSKESVARCEHGANQITRALEDAAYIASLTAEKRVLSRSVYSDFAQECGRDSSATLLAQGMARATTYELIARQLAIMLFKRNYREDKLDERLAKLADHYSKVRVVADDESVLLCVAPLTWHVVLAARMLDAGRR